MRAKCDGVMCTVKVPWSTLVLLPYSDVFYLLSEVPHIIRKRFADGCVIEVPCGAVLRVKRDKKAEYYLLADDGAIKLRGVRAKIIGMNTWGYHYIRDDTGEKVVTVVYSGKRFVRV